MDTIPLRKNAGCQNTNEDLENIFCSLAKGPRTIYSYFIRKVSPTHPVINIQERVALVTSVFAWRSCRNVFDILSSRETIER